MDIAGLPSDILVEVTASIATRSATPLIDVVNLRRSCKVFRDATAARKVGRCMAVHREWRLHWWDKARFLSVLRRCAASGNPEASYILGLEEFCNRRRKASGLRHLRRAMEHGHAAAAYMLGMITLHDSLRSSAGAAEQALEGLDWFSASASAGPSRTRRRMASVRREAVSVMRRLTMRRWRMAEPPTPCPNSWCGKVETEMVEAWDGDGDGEDERWFCSRTCRWKHEYCKFIEKI
ncbi:hypothetical protein SEVIR_1G096300v4 [Setaria viridis]|uniref:At2g35280-like TPR domain-containing protein n=3 Tax=Setaria TaxID=4554 RepID=K3YVE2_SETIT|nr:F-box protein At2g35280 [Setaria italica]XP_034591816.1 F-box protein At2g35280 [Setaria viridis]RCV05621.1 hypothetical protein SETIT_1G097400v2 [Setaria italica]TKW38173.1 hypothetical protein SEVIR_1G096300v2 [Setaria viridis]